MHMLPADLTVAGPVWPLPADPHVAVSAGEYVINVEPHQVTNCSSGSYGNEGIGTASSLLSVAEHELALHGTKCCCMTLKKRL